MQKYTLILGSMFQIYRPNPQFSLVLKKQNKTILTSKNVQLVPGG